MKKKKKRLGCYLRSYRRRWGFSQRELADILGDRDRNFISRLESQKRQPKLKDAVALCVLFGMEPQELFPALCTEIEDCALTRAYDLYERLQGVKSNTNRMKLDFLEDVFERAKRRRNGRTHA